MLMALFINKITIKAKQKKKKLKCFQFLFQVCFQSQFKSQVGLNTRHQGALNSNFFKLSGVSWCNR